MAYEHELADDEKRELLRIARATLREYTVSGRIPPGKPHRPSLCAPACTFVSLYRGDTLCGRGSEAAPDSPLYRAIQTAAIAAFSSDVAGRQPPVAELMIEVTVIGERGPQVFSDATHPKRSELPG